VADRVDDGLKVLERLSKTGETDPVRQRQLGVAAARLLESLAAFPKDTAPATAQRRTLLEDRGAALIEPAVALQSPEPVLYRQLALLAFDRGDIARGDTLLEQGIGAAAGSTAVMREEAAELRFVVAERLLADRKMAQLAGHLRTLLADESTQGRGALLAARAALAEGRLTDAEGHVAEAVRILGGAALDEIGKLREQLKAATEAIAEQEKAIQDARATLAASAREREAADRTIAVAQKAIEQLQGIIASYERAIATLQSMVEMALKRIDKLEDARDRANRRTAVLGAILTIAGIIVAVTK
jgi:tetratricopeptide (TPR) repeat protein